MFFFLGEETLFRFVFFAHFCDENYNNKRIDESKYVLKLNLFYLRETCTIIEYDCGTMHPSLFTVMFTYHRLGHQPCTTCSFQSSMTAYVIRNITLDFSTLSANTSSRQQNNSISIYDSISKFQIFISNGIVSKFK